MCCALQDEKEKWVPATKLGRLVLEKKIKSIEEIYLYSLPIKGTTEAPAWMAWVGGPTEQQALTMAWLLLVDSWCRVRDHRHAPAPPSPGRYRHWSA